MKSTKPSHGLVMFAVLLAVCVVVLVQANDAGVCGLSLTGTSLYAKVQVTEVNRVTRQLKVRWTVDPNCGFVSFQPGVPKN